VIQNLSRDGGGPAAAAGGNDAGSKVPVAGMSQTEFMTRFGSCFEFRNEATVAGQTGGQVFGLRDTMGCRQDFPGFIDNSVLLYEGKVGAVRSNAELAPVKYKVVDGKLVPWTDEDNKVAPPTPAPTPTPTPAPTAGDVTPRPSANPADVTPKAGPNPNDVTPR